MCDSEIAKCEGGDGEIEERTEQIRLERERERELALCEIRTVTRKPPSLIIGTMSSRSLFTQRASLDNLGNKEQHVIAELTETGSGGSRAKPYM